ncbi:hypothetical protein V2J09_013619 [Rumex salicifolius]
MAVQARHLNLFPSHLLYSRETLNPSSEYVSNNPAGAVVVGGGYGVSPATDVTKIQMPNPSLKDDSGLTFNNNVPPPFSRKRPREPTVGDNANIAAYFSFLGDEVSLQMIQQQSEANRLISLHMEKVKLEIEERRRNQSRSLIGAIDEAITRKLREKDEQIDRIGKLNLALEERVKSLYLENQIWRDLAQTNEATANALRSNLEFVLSQANNAGEDDAESCCGSSGEAEEGEQVLRWRKVARTSGGESKKRMCRRCGSMESSVLVLPCRHLCLCSGCGPSVDTCPVCNSTKNASVHILTSSGQYRTEKKTLSEGVIQFW